MSLDDNLEELKELFAIDYSEKESVEKKEDNKIPFDKKKDLVKKILAEEKPEEPLLLFKKEEKIQPEVAVNKEVIIEEKKPKKQEKKEEILEEKEVEKPNNIVDDFNTSEDFDNQINMIENDGYSDVKIVEPDKSLKDLLAEEKVETVVENRSNSINSIAWMRVNNDEKWKKFYEKKKSLLQTMLVDGELNFKELKKELIATKVDISSNSYNLKEITDKMQMVQSYRDRVKEIQINVSSQYYLWERMVPMLKGLLYNIEPYTRSAKGDALSYDHMRDIEEYHSYLTTLHYSVENVSKNLDKAADILSRIVTVLLPNYKADRTVSSNQMDMNYLSKNNLMIRNNVDEVREVEKTVSKPSYKEDKEEVLVDKELNDLLDYDSVEERAEEKSGKLNVIKNEPKKGWKNIFN